MSEPVEVRPPPAIGYQPPPVQEQVGWQRPGRTPYGRRGGLKKDPDFWRNPPWPHPWLGGPLELGFWWLCPLCVECGLTHADPYEARQGLNDHWNKYHPRDVMAEPHWYDPEPNPPMPDHDGSG